jgi:hypothetical protein
VHVPNTMFSRTARLLVRGRSFFQALFAKCSSAGGALISGPESSEFTHTQNSA